MRTLFTRRVILSLVSGLLTLAVVAAVMLSLNLRQSQGSARVSALATQTSVTYTVYSTPTTAAVPTSATPSGTAHTPTPTSPSQSGSSATPGSGATTPTPTKGRVPGSSLNASATPTPIPTSAPGGSLSTATPTASATSTATASAGPTATAAIPTATSAPPTPTSTTPSLVDNSTVTGTFTTTTLNQNGGWITIPITMQNTGTSTWLNDWSYYIWCVSNCMNGYKTISAMAAPGASASFGVMIYPPGVWSTTTYYSQWSMYHSGMPFGAIATIKLVVTAAIPLGVDPAPGCDTSNMSWSLSGGATCANGGLSLTSNSAQQPEAALRSAPSGFNSSNYYVTLHASFSNATGAWVRVVSYSSSGSKCGGQGLDIQPSGTFRPFSIVNCTESDGAWYSVSLPSGSTVTVTLWIRSGTWVAYIDYGLLESGSSPFTSGYPAITTGGNNGASVTVTNVELDTPVTPTTQGTLLP